MPLTLIRVGQVMRWPLRSGKAHNVARTDIQCNLADLGAPATRQYEQELLMMFVAMECEAFAVRGNSCDLLSKAFQTE